MTAKVEVAAKGMEGPALDTGEAREENLPPTTQPGTLEESATRADSEVPRRNIICVLTKHSSEEEEDPPRRKTGPSMTPQGGSWER